MSLLNSLLSSIDPAAAQVSTSSPRPTPAVPSPKPAARPAVSANNGASQAGPLKRKADGQPDGGQAKIQRKEIPTQPGRSVPPVRPMSNPDAVKARSSTPADAIPYRGTASTGGLNAPKPTNVSTKKTGPVPNTTLKKPVTAIGTSSTANNKAAVPASKPLASPAAGTTPRPVAKRGYAAMLQQAKQREQTKPPAPPVRHEPTKILTKKEREALRAAAKGKQPANGQKNAANVPKSGDSKTVDLKTKAQDKSKSTGYQGTARPIKKPVEVGYKGTAKPASMAPGSGGRSVGTSMNRGKPNQQQAKRYDGYANWSDLDEMDDEEEDYGSEDDMSDMEGGMWDVEDEEQLALKAARKEDAEALAEENEHKRQKEERKKKLAAMAKAAAGKRRY